MVFKIIPLLIYLYITIKIYIAISIKTPKTSRVQKIINIRNTDTIANNDILVQKCDESICEYQTKYISYDNLKSVGEQLTSYAGFVANLSNTDIKIKILSVFERGTNEEPIIIQQNYLTKFIRIHGGHTIDTQYSNLDEFDNNKSCLYTTNMTYSQINSCINTIVTMSSSISNVLFKRTKPQLAKSNNEFTKNEQITLHFENLTAISNLEVYSIRLSNNVRTDYNITSDYFVKSIPSNLNSTLTLQELKDVASNTFLE